MHINDSSSIWGRAYGPGSPRPFNWTYRWDGPAFDYVADNRYPQFSTLLCSCSKTTLVGASHTSQVLWLQTGHR